MATVTKVITDLVGNVDTPSKQLTKTRSDSAAPTDAQRPKEIDKVISDSVGLASSRRVFPTPSRHYDSTGLTDTSVVEMALKLTVTPIDGSGIVGLELTVSAEFGFTRFSIERVNTATGTVTAVRGGEYQVLDVNELVITLYDSECPLSNYDNVGPACYYIASAYVTDDLGLIDHDQDVQHTSDSFNLHDTAGAVWLKNPSVNVGAPSSNNKFLLDHFDDSTYSARVLASTQVLGRRNPVIVTDIMGGRQSAFVIASYPEAETVYGYAWQRSDILALIGTGETLMFQTTGDMGVEDFYFKVTGDIQEAQLSQGPATPDRLWTIQFTEVDPPENDVVNQPGGSHTWYEIATNYASWQSVLDNHTTWSEVLVNG